MKIQAFPHCVSVMVLVIFRNLGSSQELVGEKADLAVAPKKGWDTFSE
jgi:hypothetical protein